MGARWYGLELAIYGMGIVFLLLAVLAALMALLLRFDRREPEAEAIATAIPADTVDAELLAAIVIACRAHRMARRKQAAPELRAHLPGSLASRWVGSGRTRQNRSWAPGGRFA